MSKPVQLSTRMSFNHFADVLDCLRPFKTYGELHSEGPAMPGYWAEGRLDGQYKASLACADYVVYSYDTPIAWHLRGDYQPRYGVEWVMPEDKYTVTTTRHQGKIATALFVLGVTVARHCGMPTIPYN